ncbi:LuxR family transcriptional regulator [Skermania sp. ID1734]|uniref:LuxR C-terminal-related transcriptional regulator n=1 Tax=Skermania sp. ID1734 TaxID=2597516 RepID=UPI00117CA148|nr:LuxR C-terminal-related transcriptional regulator [Skermania sp. ID1734]TSE00619.1 LuxR family transcriptional regulator [Skermania sp. ID1734]
MSVSTWNGPIGVGRNGSDRPVLSKREIEVVSAWLRSESKHEVCQALFLAVGTINTHVARVRIKYASVGRPAPTKAALLARFLQDGLLRIEDL